MATHTGRHDVRSGRRTFVNTAKPYNGSGKTCCVTPGFKVLTSTSTPGYGRTSRKWHHPSSCRIPHHYPDLATGQYYPLRQHPERYYLQIPLSAVTQTA